MATDGYWRRWRRRVAQDVRHLVAEWHSWEDVQNPSSWTLGTGGRQVRRCPQFGVVAANTCVLRCWPSCPVSIPSTTLTGDAPWTQSGQSQDSVMVTSPHDDLDAVFDVYSERRMAAAAVVAEAVALALEEVAVESAEAMLVTGAAVTEAAGRAADAAESAKGARAFAAEAAAQSVAAAAARAATRVRVRAEAAAAQVRQAAAQAADELAHSIDGGTTPDARHEASLLEARVLAAAEATAEETTQAARTVRKADLAAAAQVAKALVAAEEVVEREVTASAEAQGEIAAATAAEVALATEDRAAGVARAAREAAAAPVIDDHRAASVEPEADLGEHQIDTPTRPARASGHTQDVGKILAAADERDSRAERRDRLADERDRTATVGGVLGKEQDQEASQVAEDLDLRRAAAVDRSEAKADRSAAASDRAELSAQLAQGSGVGDSSGGTRMSEVAELSQHLRGPLRSIITSVEMLEVALRESDERLRFLVDAVTDYAIISVNTEGIIESWNTGAERLKGYTPEEALGCHFSILYTAEDRETGLPQRLLDRARTEGSHETTGWRVRKDGSQFWGDIVISAVHDDKGMLTGFVKVVRDLTDQHRLESAQDSFYRAFEHDFRVPLTAIKGFAELLRSADLEEREGLVERVDSNANRLLSMVEELVAYARLRSGLVPISLQTVDMTTLAQVAVANLASIAGTARVQVTATSPVTVFTDPEAMERVIANLVTNALKYSPDDGEINLICEQVNDVGVLRIVDQGRGIDERDLDSIFLEFERGRLAQDDSGTGLGLASVQRLISLLHGTVAIRSQVDVGTTVTIELPLAR
jgi:PAS domain S-box-containing protein